MVEVTSLREQRSSGRMGLVSAMRLMMRHERQRRLRPGPGTPPSTSRGGATTWRCLPRPDGVFAIRRLPAVPPSTLSTSSGRTQHETEQPHRENDDRDDPQGLQSEPGTEKNRCEKKNEQQGNRIVSTSAASCAPRPPSHAEEPYVYRFKFGAFPRSQMASLHSRSTMRHGWVQRRRPTSQSRHSIVRGHMRADTRRHRR